MPGVAGLGWRSCESRLLLPCVTNLVDSVALGVRESQCRQNSNTTLCYASQKFWPCSCRCPMRLERGVLEAESTVLLLSHSRREV